ncbi:uncharacterized protein si:ch73-112l6.1 [Danio rerio]|uniref:Si:ch73-112l6.1 n=5 Tax=Danio rerio TaxID=7955 RepID=E9QF11_DANRE|nr:uncharacterized protein si:ch73-112l6.1 [Danio rerio]|eukprot:XP_001345268.3 uncharacterized protein si:ch73-112l6.1 [Danio rerio]
MSSSQMDEQKTQANKKLPDPYEDLLLPEGWKHTLPKEQQLWVSKALFRRDASGKLMLTEPLQLWWSNPGPPSKYSQPPPSPEPFFHSRLFLWMPCRMWAYKLCCTKPNCRRLGNHLKPCGLHNTVRKVLDISGWYFMVTEYLECCSCRKKVAGWSQDIMDQLDPIHCDKFPAVLTNRLSCDKELVRMMQCQTPGKSAVALYRHLCVRHKERWVAQAAEYLSVLQKFQDLSGVMVKVPQMVPVPPSSMLLAVYAKDALTRLGELKARVTSVYGSILKMTSVRKVTKKQDSAVWTTTVGNENEQVLMCVLTQTEGEDLHPMCSGLMERYQRAGKPPPQLLYVNRDCCSTTNKGKTAAMFTEWDRLIIRLDAWQFMQHISAGINSENHPLYGTFMGRLFSCIFEWDVGDVKRLHEAKRQEMCQSTDGKVSNKPTAEELIRHCRHQTRGAQVTRQLIEQLLKEFIEATDFMGNKLMEREKMEEIWRAQQCHLSCIQDPPGIQLYKKVKEVTRGGLSLPIYNCARGVGSVELFHKHLNHFIPGISANDLHFHIYLVDGIVQWNKSRSAAAEEVTPLQRYANHMSQKLLGCKLVEDHNSPEEYTGELMGVEYLYSQTSRVLEVDDFMDPDAPDESDGQIEGDLEDDDSDIDHLRSPKFLELSLKPLHHGQCQAVLLQSTSSGTPTSQPDPIVSSTSGPIKDEPIPEDQFMPRSFLQENEEEEEEKGIGPDGVPGYNHVINLANSLVELRSHGFITQRKVEEIVALWDKLSDYDKGGVVLPVHPEDGLHFSNRHTDAFVTPCTNGLKNRLVAAVCLALSHIHPVDQTVAGVRVSRWTAILRDYSMIRNIVQDSPAISSRTRIQLLEINQRTLSQWYSTKEQSVLHQWLDSMKTSEALLPLPHNITNPVHYGPAGDVIKVVIGVPSPANAVPLQTEQRVLTTRPACSKVPRTTAWRRRKAEEEAAQRGLPLKRLFEQYLCKKCGNPKTKEFGHSQFRGVHFCARTSGKTVEQWMEEMRSVQKQSEATLPFLTK